MKKFDIFNMTGIDEKLIALYGPSKGVRAKRDLRNKKKKIFITTIVITLLLTMVATIYEVMRPDKYIQYIERGPYNSGTKSVSLKAEYLGTAEDIEVIVDDIKYTEEELITFANEVEEKLPESIVGSNISLDEVTSDLKLVSKLNNYPFDISWKIQEPLLVDSSGKLNTQRIAERLNGSSEQAIPVRLIATLEYDDFSEDIYIYAVLVEDNVVTKERLSEDIARTIKQMGIDDKTSSIQRLPSEVDGVDIKYVKNEPNVAAMLCLIGCVCAFGLIYGKDKEVEKELKKRCVEMDSDYPKILNQYALYYYAGMNQRAIWEEICSKYEKKVTKGDSNNQKKRYAYEEMLITKRDLADGVGELQAYEAFATRCQNIKYRAFISLIEQSVKKGGVGLGICIEEEVEKARREEVNNVRKNAQELSTKLLLPMLMMLLIVLVIVMVPAFISFKS